MLQIGIIIIWALKNLNLENLMGVKITVIKLTKNKKAVLIYDDEGKCYITSVVFLQGLLMGKAKGDFITTSRLPYNAAVNRFKPSELYDPAGVFKGDAAKTLTTNNDGLSQQAIKDKEVKKVFVDKKVW